MTMVKYPKYIFGDTDTMLSAKTMLWFWILILGSSQSILAGSTAGISSMDEAYRMSPDFKAVSQAFHNGRPFLMDGNPVKGYAWNYDTAREAVDAAGAYCRRQIPDRYRQIRCRIIVLGRDSVFQDQSLNALIETYEKKLIRELETDLAKTGKREVITRLSTILQKTGEYAESEKLLYDLAMGGEHLAQNALAYHWAELKKNLPEALSLIDEAILQNPGFFSYHNTRALVLFRLGRTQEALKEAHFAVNLQAHPIALDHYGDLLWLAGRTKEAVRQWEAAAEATQNILFVQRLKEKIKTGMTGDIVFE